NLAQTIKAHATLARMDVLAQGARAHEIHLFEDGCGAQLVPTAGSSSVDAGRADFSRQPHLHDVADVAAFDQTQSTFVHQAANRLSHAFARNGHIVGQPYDRKAQAGLAFEAAVPEQMRIDHAVEDRQVELRGEKVLEFLPHLYSVEFL